MTVQDDIIECAQNVQGELGGGHRENVYHKAFMLELADAGLVYSTESTFPVLYRDFAIARMHPDLVVGDDDRYVVELKVNRDGTEQLARYLEHAEKNGRDDIKGGVMISFGDQLEYNTL